MQLVARARPHTQAPAFCDQASVEAWDAWFRWRDAAGLHDADIAATWRRVADALASVERGAEARRAGEFAEMLRNWSALPDPRILASAGTGKVSWPSDDLTAAVNVAACVRDAFTAQSRLDLAALENAAASAVRMLDNAILLAGRAGNRAPRLRVGLIGMADALLMLGRDYDSVDALVLGRRVAAALALGCARESMQLAKERGAWDRTDSADFAPAVAPLIEALAVDSGSRSLRHRQLTAVVSQRQLALLANNVADALDPLRGELQVYRIDSAAGARLQRSSGCALAQLARRPMICAVAALKVDTVDKVARAAQQMLRNALQPWIDATIDYPLATPQNVVQCAELDAGFVAPL